MSFLVTEHDGDENEVIGRDIHQQQWLMMAEPCAQIQLSSSAAQLLCLEALCAALQTIVFSSTPHSEP